MVGHAPDPSRWRERLLERRTLSVHLSRGCSHLAERSEDLVGTGGNGLFYCFAIG